MDWILKKLGRMIALGSGDPTRAICSTMIAQAFGLVHYPILPTYRPPVKENPSENPAGTHPDAAWEEVRDEPQADGFTPAHVASPRGLQ